MKRKILIGQKFGHLTVIDEKYGVQRGNRKRTICICKCDCGNTVERVKESLSKDKNCHCGCGRKETASTLAKDVVGKKYGKLIVIEELTECTPRKLVCLCECGNTVTALKTDIMAGHTKSCGCLRKENITKSNTKDWRDHVFSSGVKAIEPSEKNSHGVWLWKFKCPFCDNNFIALPANVSSGKVQSCGCITQSSNEVSIEKILTDKGIDNIPQYRFDDCKDKRTLPFDFALLKNGKVYALIEYDGRQHNEPVSLFGGEDAFAKIKKHDEMKNEYCKKNNIPLYRFNYKQSLEEITNEITNIINP